MDRLVNMVLDDLAKVIVDYPRARWKKDVDTGGFVLLHRSKMEVTRPTGAMLTNLSVDGVKLTKA